MADMHFKKAGNLDLMQIQIQSQIHEEKDIIRHGFVAVDVHCYKLLCCMHCLKWFVTTDMHCYKLCCMHWSRRRWRTCGFRVPVVRDGRKWTEGSGSGRVGDDENTDTNTNTHTNIYTNTNTQGCGQRRTEVDKGV